MFLGREGDRGRSGARPSCVGCDGFLWYWPLSAVAVVAAGRLTSSHDFKSVQNAPCWRRCASQGSTGMGRFVEDCEPYGMSTAQLQVQNYEGTDF